MNYAQAAKIWSQAFAVNRPEERFRFLRRLEAAAPQDVVKLARRGRRRFDKDHQGWPRNSSYLFAKSRDGNTLADVVQIRSSHGTKTRIGSIETYATMTIARIPKRFYVTCLCTGQSGIAAGGRQVFMGPVGTGKFIAELERAVPRLASYGTGNDITRCLWTAQEVKRAYGDWLAQVNSRDPARSRSAIVAAPSFWGIDFADEARQALGDVVRPAVLAALSAPDPAARTSALRLIRELQLEDGATADIAAQLMESEETARRADGLELAKSTARTLAEELDAIRRQLSDSDRNVRWSAAENLKYERIRFSGPLAKDLHAMIAQRLEAEPDTQILSTLERFQIECAPLDDATVRYLCRVVDTDSREEIRRLALVRFKRDENRHALKTALRHFDAFPVQAADIVIAAKDYSPRTKARMARLADDPNWSLRWRFLDYVEECPKISTGMVKLVEKLQSDAEFTIRESADRLMRELKRRKRAALRNAKAGK